MKRVFFSKTEGAYYTAEPVNCAVCKKAIEGACEWFIAWFTNQPSIHELYHYTCKWKAPLVAGMAKSNEIRSIVCLPDISCLPKDAKIRAVMPPELACFGRSTFMIADDLKDGAKIIDRTKYSFRQTQIDVEKRKEELEFKDEELRSKPKTAEEVDAWLKQNVIDTKPDLPRQIQHKPEEAIEMTDENKWECRSCGDVTRVEERPVSCSCGNKTDFAMLNGE